MIKYCLWIALLVLASCGTRNYVEITPKGVEFQGIKDCQKQNINILITHGMGNNDDFSQFDYLIEGIAGKMDFVFVRQDSFQYPDEDYDNCLNLEKSNGIAGNATLIVKEYQKKEDGKIRNLRFYTVFWSDITRAAKEWLIAHDKHPKKKKLNREGKDLVVNEGISDVVFYNGEFKGLMQLPFILTIDRMISNDPFRPSPLGDLNEDDNYANFIISGSFGSKIILDVLNDSRAFFEYVDGVDDCLKSRDSSLFKNTNLERILGTLNLPGKIFPEDQATDSGKLPRQFYLNLDRIYLLSNQIPLFGLEDLAPNSTVEEIENTIFDNSWPGTNLAPSKTQELEIVAFNDPNDFLGYPLPENGNQNIINVRMNFGKKHYFVAVDPIQAHEDSKKDPRTVDLIVNGYDGSRNIRKRN